MTPLEKYAQVILHSGCAIPPIGEIESRSHRWDECRSQRFYMRMARKQQHKLKSNGIVVGVWVKKEQISSPIHQVIARWYKAGLLRFNSHDDGSDDLLLAEEIIRAINASVTE